MIVHYTRSSIFPPARLVLSVQDDIPFILFELALRIRAGLLMRVDVSFQYYLCIAITHISLCEDVKEVANLPCYLLSLLKTAHILHHLALTVVSAKYYYRHN